jgi:energy-converting hydrogenase Eha subunit A
MTRHARLARRVVLGAVVGALCAVLSAWVPQVADYAFSENGLGSWVTGDSYASQLESEYGGTLGWANVYVGYGMYVLDFHGDLSQGTYEGSQLTPWWGRPIGQSRPERIEFDTSVAFAYGWPSPCLRWRVGARTIAASPECRERTADGVWVLHKGTKASPLLLAIDPLWPGLIANAAFYGTVIVGGAFALRAFRRHRRRSRGWCVSCGYDLAGVALPACPECGRERDGSPSTAPA